MDKGSGSGIFPVPDPVTQNDRIRPDSDPGDLKRPDPTGCGSGSAILDFTAPGSVSES